MRDATDRVHIPRGIWALGFVSLFMDVSSEMIHALLPAFLVTVLGASAVTLGLIEGLAEAIANITKVFSGVLSDWARRRKPLLVIGYGLAALTKPVFALAQTVGAVVAARVTDRIGKGIRGAPRDALIADMAPTAILGASFGLRQSLDTVGAFLGPLAAMGLMLVTANSFRAVFWAAAVPAAIAMAVLLFGVRDTGERRSVTHHAPRLADVRRFPRAYWSVVAVAVVLMLARFSEAFLLLRAQDVGLGLALVPLVMIVMNMVYSATAFPAGAIADRVGRTRVLSMGIGFLLVADLVLAFGETVLLTMLGVALWGLHMGFSHGLVAALVAESAPADLRGSAFGIYNLAIGLALLVASVLAGALWDAFGPRATFTAGAGLALAAFLLHAYVQAAGPRSARPAHRSG